MAFDPARAFKRVLKILYRIARRTWLIIGLLLVLSFISLFILQVYSQFVHSSRDGHMHEHSRMYMSDKLPHIIASFDKPEIFAEYLHSSYKVSLRKGEMEYLLDLYSTQLGDLVELNELEGISASANSGFGALGAMILGHAHIFAYSIPLVFEKGRAELQMTLVEEGGEWLITSFHLQSPQLYNRSRRESNIPGLLKTKN